MMVYQSNKRKLSNIGLVIIFIVFIFNDCIAQIHDNINWTSIKISEPLSDHAKLIVAPTIRFNNNVSSYQNSSLDVAIKHQFHKHWHYQVLSRTWFIPEESGRQFIWLDLGYNQNLGDYKLASHLRIHQAFDINQRNDPDYLRWKTTLSLPKWKSIQFHVAIEPWLRLNEGMQLQRMRYEPGVHINVSSSVRLTMIYRKEDSINIIPYKKFNMYLVSLGYNAPWIW